MQLLKIGKHNLKTKHSLGQFIYLFLLLCLYLSKAFHRSSAGHFLCSDLTTSRLPWLTHIDFQPCLLYLRLKRLPSTSLGMPIPSLFIRQSHREGGITGISLWAPRAIKAWPVTLAFLTSPVHHSCAATETPSHCWQPWTAALITCLAGQASCRGKLRMLFHCSSY